MERCPVAFLRTMNFYFGWDHDLEDLECENCIEYISEVCEGKGYRNVDVLLCIESKVDKSEKAYSNYLKAFNY